MDRSSSVQTRSGALLSSLFLRFQPRSRDSAVRTATYLRDGQDRMHPRSRLERWNEGDARSQNATRTNRNGLRLFEFRTARRTRRAGPRRRTCRRGRACRGPIGGGPSRRRAAQRAPRPACARESSGRSLRQLSPRPLYALLAAPVAQSCDPRGSHVAPSMRLPSPLEAASINGFVRARVSNRPAHARGFRRRLLSTEGF